MKPPMMIPRANVRFHRPLDFQSYWKNDAFVGRAAAQMCRRFDEMPNSPPARSSNGTTRPIRIPATYQGHGCDMSSIMRFLQLN